MKEDILDALVLMPQHRLKHKRSRSTTLDDLIDDQRSLGNLRSSSFDYVMMGYRFHHLFQRDLKAFLKKPLQPKLIEDLLQIAFAAILSRKEEQESGLVFWTVEIAKEHFNPAIGPMVNAFCRHIQREKPKLLELSKSHPELLLGKELSSRWKKFPNLIQRTSIRLSDRPESGIEGFTSDFKWQRYETKVLKEQQFQAMNRASWDFCQLSLKEIRKHLSGKKVSILDACAAPGAKLICLQQGLKNSSEAIDFWATEAKFSRMDRLKENLNRWELQNTVSTKLFSWGEGNTWENGPHDLIFADLPCTGSGTIIERPDLLIKDFKEELSHLSKIQTSILEQLMGQLKAGGVLFVSICSIDPEEIENISKFLGIPLTYDTRTQKERTFEDLVGWFFKKN
ncbi:hypothetical protein GW915_01055 [bacterium]|nr:hypothetical protein [bacterium]